MKYLSPIMLVGIFSFIVTVIITAVIKLDTTVTLFRLSAKEWDTIMKLLLKSTSHPSKLL